jgi:hypothetical protein
MATCVRISILITVLALLVASCSRPKNAAELPKEFNEALGVFLDEASKLASMTEATAKQPEFEEQLKVVEAAFVKADRIWPHGDRYSKARALFAEALDDWRACNELRVAVLLGHIRATAEGQVAVLSQDRRLDAKSRSRFDSAQEQLTDLRTREARASHKFAQGRAYLD